MPVRFHLIPMISIKNITSILFLVTSLSCLAQSPAKLTLQLNGSTTGKVYFEVLVTNKPTIDSLILKNGVGEKEFSFEQPTTVKIYDHYSFLMKSQLHVKNTPSPDSKPKGNMIKDESHDLFRKALLGMKFGGQEDHFELIIRPGEQVNLSANVGKLAISNVTGKDDVTDYGKLEQQLTSLKENIEALETEVIYFQGTVDESVYIKYDDQLTGLKAKMNALAFEYVKSHSSSEYAPKVALAYLPLVQTYVQQLPKVIPEEILSQPMWTPLKRMINMFRSVNIGKENPDFTAQDINGKPFKFSDTKGKLVLLDFWASWCTPCRAENPYVRYIYNRYHNKGLEIVSFSVDDKLDAWKKAVEEDGLAWAQVSDLKGMREGVAKQFEISGVPTNFLVKDGRVIGVFLRWQSLNALLQEYLGK